MTNFDFDTRNTQNQQQNTDGQPTQTMPEQQGTQARSPLSNIMRRPPSRRSLFRIRSMVRLPRSPIPSSVARSSASWRA